MPFTLAKTQQDLNTAWFKDLLKHIGNGDAAAQLEQADVHPIGTGQMGFVVRAVLTFSGDGHGGPGSLIIKLASPDATARQTGLALGIFQAEVNFYNEIAPLTEMTLPPCLFSAVDDEGWLTIVLADLSGESAQGDVLKGGTPDQARHALGELAKLQAPFWNRPDWQSKPWLSPASAAPLYDVPPLALDAFIERFGHALAPGQRAIFETVFARSTLWFQAWSAPLTLTHGDFRLDNILLPITDGAPPMVTIDWQTVKMGPPLIDVAYYLGACLTTEARRSNEEDLLRHYQRYLAELGVDYPWEALWRDYRFAACYGVLLCAFAVKVPQTERGDQMFIQTALRYADMAADLNSLALIDE
ncbi:ecdysteroid 22-kinase family protein [Spongiibacter taiwanensis]|uniref:ecdysteroid 22-kinase family protein n=1 Tax=Spongiibacter taiwanensis TaxID=1748242 RepID=UPI0020356973|nr:ecdysteroid 22-kinase family protein [Spongiibacter taiwanensis]USA42621.1 ecdysteroid 22-kinase family protein [Spongiibacter taiwanensis]